MPDLGHTTPGASITSLPTDRAVMHAMIAPEAGTLESVSVWFGNFTVAAGRGVRAAVYVGGAGNSDPNGATLLEDLGVIAPAVGGTGINVWVTKNSTSHPTWSSGNRLWLVLKSNDGGPTRIGRDFGAHPYGNFAAQPVDDTDLGADDTVGFPASLTTPSGNHLSAYSTYLTYSVSGAGAAGAGQASHPPFGASGAGEAIAAAEGAASHPAFGASGVGDVPVVGTGSAAHPAFLGGGSSAQSVAGAGAVTHPAFQVDGAGLARASGAAAVEHPPFSISGDGLASVGGVGAATLPAFSGVGAGQIVAAGAGAASHPAFGATGGQGMPGILYFTASLEPELRFVAALEPELDIGRASLAPELTFRGSMEPS